MIITGIKTVKKLLGYHQVIILCPSCQETVRMMTFREVEWLTLFFVPLLPTSVNYYHCCPYCNRKEKIKKKSLPKLHKGNT